MEIQGHDFNPSTVILIFRVLVVDHISNKYRKFQGGKFRCIPRWEDHRFHSNISWIPARANTGNWVTDLEEY